MSSPKIEDDLLKKMRKTNNNYFSEGMDNSKEKRKSAVLELNDFYSKVGHNKENKQSKID